MKIKHRKSVNIKIISAHHIVILYGFVLDLISESENVNLYIDNGYVDYEYTYIWLIRLDLIIKNMCFWVRLVLILILIEIVSWVLTY